MILRMRHRSARNLPKCPVPRHGTIPPGLPYPDLTSLGAYPMRGIRVRQQYDKGGKAAPSPIPAGQSRFAFIFRPILPRLAEYVWVISPGDWPFDFPREEKF